MVLYFLNYLLVLAIQLYQLTKITMKKAVQITGKIIYFIVAMSPIFALGYMLGMKL
jgi:hypothetical protein